MLMRLIKSAFICPQFILGMLGAISVAALISALTAQFVFGLQPCPLCIYQRFPYVVVAVLAALGIWGTKMGGALYGAFNIALAGLAFYINTGIAIYHVGVEQKWWASEFCSSPDFANQSIEDMQAAILNAPTISCDQIPWELFGISMAGYNVLLCGALGLYCTLTAAIIWHRNKL